MPRVRTRRVAQPKPISRLAQSEARLLTAAISCTGIVCAVLVAYLAAYAQITSLGIQQAKARVQLRAMHAETEMLRNEYADLRSPTYIASAAGQLQMTQADTKACYIAPSTSASGSTADMDGARSAMNDDQPADSAGQVGNDVTTDTNGAASRRL